MPKLTLSTIGSRYGSIDALNANFDAIEDALDNTLSRDGSIPNTMEATLDLNGNPLINVSSINGADATTLSEDLATVAANASNINEIVGSLSSIATVADEIEDVVTVAQNIVNVNGVAGNIGSVELVGLDLNGQFQSGVIYDFGLITDSPVGPAPESDSSIVIVANNITDVNVVADNIQDVIDALSNANDAAASAASAASDAASASIDADSASTSAANAAISETNAAAYELSANEWAIKTSGPVAGGEYSAKWNAQQASSSASSASTSASNAASSASLASSAKDDAITAQLAAESALASTLSAYDSFDDRYLGAKGSDPSTDNDGDPLVGGALYFLTGSGMKIWTGSTWEFAYVPGGTYLAKANNLSDLTNISDARTNLGLATVASTGAYSDLSGTPTLATVATSGSYNDLSSLPTLGDLASLDEVGTSYITNNAVTVDKLAATLDFGSIV